MRFGSMEAGILWKFRCSAIHFFKQNAHESLLQQNCAEDELPENLEYEGFRFEGPLLWH